MKNDQLEIVPAAPQPVARPLPSPIELLEAAISGGITSEKVAVVKELVVLCREQKAEDSKAAFAKAFFHLRKNLPEIYADKAVKDNDGRIICSYATEREINEKLEPHLMSNGFTTLVGQTEKDGKITVAITLIHEAGHSETREFTVRSLTSNRAMDGAKCDAGAATLAWRHLMIKMFGLKSHIVDDDARVEGEFISLGQAEELQRRVMETESDELRFLVLAGIKGISGKPTLEHYKAILSGKYEMLDEQLSKKEHRGR